MVDVARARKLAVRIREVVAQTLELQVKDPRLGMVTITDAKVTPDLREATLYYTVYGDDQARADSAAALESAKGVLRSQAGRQTGVRAPALHDPGGARARARPDSAAGLESAKGVLRSQVGRQTGVRYTPSLAFVADVVPETTGRLEELLEKARLADARVQEIASAA